METKNYRMAVHFDGNILPFVFFSICKSSNNFLTDLTQNSIPATLPSERNENEFAIPRTSYISFDFYNLSR